MLSVRGATVRYGAVTAVDAVDLDVPDGCVLALLGPSGCGKSTLLRAIAGLEPLTAGSVGWDAVDLARIPVHRRGFGLMFQEGVLFPHRTVAGNVVYGLRGQTNARSRVSELLELVGLSGYGPRRVATLSGGEAQRVALARALAPRPRLLLLDEPLAALDRALREQLLVDLRTALTTTGTTSIFVTHDQGEAFAIADRVAVMRAGRIVQVGEPRVVWTHPVDEWTARFLGCSSVITAAPEQGPDGTWRSVTAFGSVAGRAEQVGLRPSALVVDPEGPIRGAVTSVVAGPDQQRVGVRLARDGFADDGEVPGGDESAGGGGGAAGDEVQAVAHPSEALAPGDIVRLRWDPDGAALIGSSDEVIDLPAGSLVPVEPAVARRFADTPGS
jgi:thiamine transport system ATP-binding protein